MNDPVPTQTPAEYMDWEDNQPDRHEFHSSRTWPATSLSIGHQCVTGKLACHLGNHLDGSACQVFIGGMKVQIAGDTVLYPDLFVTCGQDFHADDPVVTDPILVVEVLSPSTQAYDRSLKFALYRRLPSLREYALIDPDARRVEVLRLGDDGLWNFIDFSEQADVELASVDFKLALIELFKDMDCMQTPAR